MVFESLSCSIDEVLQNFEDILLVLLAFIQVRGLFIDDSEEVMGKVFTYFQESPINKELD
jgi:hypothetical protein